MTEKPRILFVDDEPHILQGLRRMLHSVARDWTLEFAQGGVAALALMQERRVDVLVTDMRMPGMDGATLLQRVRDQWPEVTRIVLSGHSDHEGVIRAINAAHQYLAKPCDPGILKQTIGRALRLRGLLASGDLRALISRLSHVPSLPSLYVEITNALADKDCTVRQVGEIIGRDISFSLKLLQIVNSAFFGLPRATTSPVDAAVLLGTDLIRVLLLFSKVFSSAEERMPEMDEIRALWRHSLRTAVLAREFATSLGLERGECDTSFLAAFAHNLGRMVLLENLPEESKRCASLIREGRSERDAETSVFGATHVAVSAWLLGTWGLPDAAVEAVAFLHEPGNAPTQVVAPLTAAHVAEAFDSEIHASVCRGGLDVEYLRRLGLLEKAVQWREGARGLCVEQGGAK